MMEAPAREAQGNKCDIYYVVWSGDISVESDSLFGN